MPFNKPIEKRYFTITEVAKELGLTASQLRYWEKEFAPLNPRTNARGKRYYTASDKELIQQIAWLVKDQGYTIDGARRAMKKRNEVAEAMAASAEPSGNTGAHQAEVLNKLYDVRDRLRKIQEDLNG
jgi:DNA-binding transcriptional MerR regulator